MRFSARTRVPSSALSNPTTRFAARASRWRTPPRHNRQSPRRAKPAKQSEPSSAPTPNSPPRTERQPRKNRRGIPPLRASAFRAPTPVGMTRCLCGASITPTRAAVADCRVPTCRFYVWPDQPRTRSAQAFATIGSQKSPHATAACGAPARTDSRSLVRRAQSVRRCAQTFPPSFYRRRGQGVIPSGIAARSCLSSRSCGTAAMKSSNLSRVFGVCLEESVRPVPDWQWLRGLRLRAPTLPLARPSPAAASCATGRRSRRK